MNTPRSSTARSPLERASAASARERAQSVDPTLTRETLGRRATRMRRALPYLFLVAGIGVACGNAVSQGDGSDPADGGPSATDSGDEDTGEAGQIVVPDGGKADGGHDAASADAADDTTVMDLDATTPPMDVSVPPAVLSVSPSNGDDNVPVATPIQATFSAPVVLGGLPASLALGDAGVLGVTFALTPDEKTLTSSPAAPLPTPAPLTATLQQIGNSAGQQLSPDFSWSWTVPFWLRVGTDAQESDGFASIAAGPGSAFVAAVDQYNSAGCTEIVRTAPSIAGPWTDLGPLDPQTPSECGASVVVDSSGAPVVGYLDDLNTVRVQRWSGGSWTDVAGPVATGTAWSVPQLAIDASSTVYVMDQEPDADAGAPATQLVVRKLVGGVWTPLGAPVFAGDLNGGSPGFAVSASGVPYVTYETNTVNGIHVSSWSGSAWVPVGSTIGAGDGPCGYLAIALDSGGNPFVFGAFANYALENLTFRLFNLQAGAWTQLGNVVETEARVGSTPYPGLVGGPSGHVFGGFNVCALTDGGLGETCEVEAVDVTASGWTKIDNAVNGAMGTAVESSTVAVDPGGVPVIAWSEVDAITDAGAAVGTFSVRRLNR